ncbi:MAG: hypothetical protein ACYTEK_09825 [Planctomycetota bacterium]|jgi:hypothetical protein
MPGKKFGIIEKIVAGVATAVLTAAILSYLGLSKDSEPTPEPPPQIVYQREPTPQREIVYVPEPAPEREIVYVPEPAPQPADFSGRWRTPEGVIYEIQQTGQSFQITEYSSMPFIGTIPSLLGQGTIEGRNAQFSYTGMSDIPGSGSIQMSADGSQLTITARPLFGMPVTVNAYR